MLGTFGRHAGGAQPACLSSRSPRRCPYLRVAVGSVAVSAASRQRGRMTLAAIEHALTPTEVGGAGGPVAGRWCLVVAGSGERFHAVALALLHDAYAGALVHRLDQLPGEPEDGRLVGRAMAADQRRTRFGQPREHAL